MWEIWAQVSLTLLDSMCLLVRCWLCITYAQALCVRVCVAWCPGIPVLLRWTCCNSGWLRSEDHPEPRVREPWAGPHYFAIITRSFSPAHSIIPLLCLWLTEAERDIQEAQLTHREMNAFSCCWQWQQGASQISGTIPIIGSLPNHPLYLAATPNKTFSCTC